MAKFDVLFLVQDHVSVSVEALDSYDAEVIAGQLCDELTDELSRIAHMSFVINGEDIVVMPHAEIMEVIQEV